MADSLSVVLCIYTWHGTSGGDKPLDIAYLGNEHPLRLAGE